MIRHSNERAVVEEKHWDEIARHRDTQVITSESVYLASLPAVWRDIHGRAYNFLPRNLTGKTVLDFGCGYGVSSAIFLLRGASVTGLDISPRMIALATAQAQAIQPDARFEGCVGTERDLAEWKRSFDYIFCGAVLHHLPEFDDGIQSLWSRLNPGGVLVAYEPVDSPLSSLIRRRVRYLGKHRHEEETPLRAAQIAHLQHLAGNSEYFYYKFFTGVERFFLSHGRWFHWFMTQLDRGCSKGIGWTGWHVVMALKKF